MRNRPLRTARVTFLSFLLWKVIWKAPCSRKWSKYLFSCSFFDVQYVLRYSALANEKAKCDAKLEVAVNIDLLQLFSKLTHYDSPGVKLGKWISQFFGLKCHGRGNVLAFQHVANRKSWLIAAQLEKPTEWNTKPRTHIFELTNLRNHRFTDFILTMLGPNHGVYKLRDGSGCDGSRRRERRKEQGI